MASRFLAVFFASSLALLGCSAGEDEPASTESHSVPRQREAWMGGTWWTSSESGGDYSGESLNLDADGTGTRGWATIRPNLGGLGDEGDGDHVGWWSDEGDLVLNGVRRKVVATPNCRLVKLDGVLYEHSPEGPCPFGAPPLTDIESQMVGHWTFAEERGSDGDYGYLNLRIENDRYIALTYHPDMLWATRCIGDWSLYFTVDSDGVLHATGVGGTEQFTMNFKVTPGGLSWCDDFHPTDCRPLKRM